MPESVSQPPRFFDIERSPTEEIGGTHGTQDDNPQRRRPIAQCPRAISSICQIARDRGKRAPWPGPFDTIWRPSDQHVTDGEHTNHGAQEVDGIQGIDMIRLVPVSPGIVAILALGLGQGAVIDARGV